MMTHRRHQTRGEGVVQSLAAERHVTEDAEEQTHCEPRTSGGRGRGSHQTEQAPPPGRQVTGRRRQPQARTAEARFSVPRPGCFKTQSTKQSKPFIRHQAQLNGCSLPDPEKSQAPKTRKRREGQTLAQGTPGSGQRCSGHPAIPGLWEEKPRPRGIRHPA